MTSLDFERMRKAMVDSQLRTNAVTDARVLDAMGRIAREDHVPAAARALAYADLPIALGPGVVLNAPMVTGRLLNEAKIRPADTVLVVAPQGSDYVAAVASALAASVVTIAPEAAVADVAGGPFDVIVVDGAIEAVPDSLVGALRPGGRLVTGLVDRGVTRLAVGHRSMAGFGLVAFADADVAVLKAFSQPHDFAF